MLTKYAVRAAGGGIGLGGQCGEAKCMGSLCYNITPTVYGKMLPYWFDRSINRSIDHSNWK